MFSKSKRLGILFTAILTLSVMACNNQKASSITQVSSNAPSSVETSSEALPSSNNEPSSTVLPSSNNEPSSSYSISSIEPSSSSVSSSNPISSSNSPISSLPPSSFNSSSIPQSSNEPVVPPMPDFDNVGEAVEYVLDRFYKWEATEDAYHTIYRESNGTPNENCASIYNALISGGFVSITSPVIDQTRENAGTYHAECYYKALANYAYIYAWDEENYGMSFHYVEIIVPSIKQTSSLAVQKWLRVDKTDDLKDGDVVVVGVESKAVVLSGSIYGNSTNYFMSANVDFSEHSIEELPTLTVLFKVRKIGNEWKLISEKGLFGAISNQKMAWNDGTTAWSISIESGEASISAGKENPLTLMYYLETGGRFSIFESTSQGSAYYPEIYRLTLLDPVYPTSIEIDGTDTLSIGHSATLNVIFTPNDTNIREVIWSSSDSTIAEVDAETGAVTAKAVGEVTITATTKDAAGNDIIAEHHLTITGKTKAKWTLMIYMCGSDLESDAGCATSDIKEMLGVKNQPDDVEIIIETGGSTKWKRYGISNNKLSHYHIANQELVLDETLKDASMGKQSTFESFLQWGLESYPAENTGVILWNHGGAMSGACSDARHGNDSLLNSEASAAFAKVLGDQKLEFIGYDCCLMQVQDIADFNAPYFKYMIASEEAEDGNGWAYEGLLDALYAKKSTEEVLKATCDAFIASTDESLTEEYNDQTLSYLDLSKMPAYRTAFEDLATSLTSTLKTKSFNEFVIENVYSYGDTWVSQDDYDYYIENGYYETYMFDSYVDPETSYHYLYGMYDFASFDVLDFLTQAKTLNLGTAIDNKIDATLAALDELVAYSATGKIAKDSGGLALIYPVDEYVVNYSYLAKETSFTNWHSAVCASDRVF